MEAEDANFSLFNYVKCYYYSHHRCNEQIRIMINLPVGMKDIDAIVERFMEAEDANFSLFNYVNEVNAEVEKLEEQIAEIKVLTEKLGSLVVSPSLFHAFQLQCHSLNKWGGKKSYASHVLQFDFSTLACNRGR